MTNRHEIMILWKKWRVIIMKRYLISIPERGFERGKYYE